MPFLYGERKAGITLVALVVTIIVLIILAAVTISLLVGNNGIISKASRATKDYGAAAEEEQLVLKLLAEGWGREALDKIVDVVDGVPIPKGFKVSKEPGENTKNGGLVIIDIAEGSTNGNEFVWVPVANPTTMYEIVEGKKRAKLYNFGTNENPNNPPVAITYPETRKQRSGHFGRCDLWG